MEFDSEPTPEAVDSAWQSVKEVYKPKSRKDDSYKMFVDFKMKEQAQKGTERRAGMLASIPEQVGNVGKFVSSVGNVLTP